MAFVQHLDKPADAALQDRLQQLALEHFNALSALPLPDNNALKPLYQYVLGFELHRYLERMQHAHHAKPQLVLAWAEENCEHLIGFALYLPSVNNHQACTVLQLLVLGPWRGSKIAEQMLSTITSRYPHTQVACRADQADFFVHKGFYPHKAHGPQVLLSTQHEPVNGSFSIEPLEPIFASKEVRQIYTYVLKQQGQLALKAAEINRDQLLKQLAEQAQSWFRSWVN